MDRSKGTLTFLDGRLLVGPTLRRCAFLESPLAKDAKISVQNEPWCSWDLRESPREAPGFRVRLCFQGEHLRQIELCYASPAFGETWSDWSRSKERMREKSHKAWLDETVGAEREFAWGTVWSGYDDKTGYASIVVKYGAVEQGDEPDES